MDDPIRGARRSDELLELGEHGPYVFTHMFSTAGWRARSRAKRTLKLLKRIDPQLRAMLAPDERVFFITQGVAQPSLLEWYLLGAALYYLNRRAIVLTNRRIILLQIDSRRRPREMRNEIAYTAIVDVENTFFGSVRVTFRSGGRLRLVGIPRAERKWLAATLVRLTESFRDASDPTELTQLCPWCYERVTEHPAACPHCEQAFKSPRTAALLSLAFPGAGDLYLGHRGFAYLEMLGAGTLWTVFVVVALDMRTGLLEILLLLGSAVVLAHGIDAFTTHRIARAGLVPDAGRSSRRRFVAAGIIPVVSLALIAWTVPERVRLRPGPAVVTGAGLPAAHRSALQASGYLLPGETVQYFYSAGPTSILQDGSLLTGDRVVSYVSTLEGSWQESAWMGDIVDIEVTLAEPPEPLSYITVLRHDGVGFYLTAGTAGGHDRAFTSAFVDQWMATRLAGAEPWFDGGSGSTPDDAIVVRGAIHTAAADSLQRWWLSAWYGEEGANWRLLDQRILPPDSAHEWRIGRPNGEEDTVYFRLARAQ